MKITASELFRIYQDGIARGRAGYDALARDVSPSDARAKLDRERHYGKLYRKHEHDSPTRELAFWRECGSILQKL